MPQTMIGEFGSAGPLPSESTAADRGEQHYPREDHMCCVCTRAWQIGVGLSEEGLSDEGLRSGQNQSQQKR